MSEYFSPEELECPCCSEIQMDDDFMCILGKLREDFDYPMPVTSGYRCESHNADVGGSAKSQHLEGNAVDVAWGHFPAKYKFKLVQFALDYGFSGLGIGDEFIHLDRRGGAGKMWTY